MTRNELIDMAKQSGAFLVLTMSSPPGISSASFPGDALERFANLIIQQERAACLAIVEAPHWKPAVRAVLKQRAEQIRERSAS